jgi:hypothetical protein
MPNYPTTVSATTLPAFPPTALWPGEFAYLFNAESPAAPQASDRVAIGNKDMNYPASISVEVQFSAAPGAFELDVQDADTDADAYYQNVSGGQLTAVSAAFTGRIELVPIKGRFLRVRLASLDNAVQVTARVQR